MQQGTTLIPGQRSPSLSKMARASGWSKRHLQRGLTALEQAGLIIRHRPTKHDARVNHARTRYTVVYERLRELGTQRLQEAGDTASQPLGTQRPAAGDTMARGLGTARPEARDTTAQRGQNAETQPDAETDHELDLITGVLKTRTGVTVTADWAARTRDLILARPGAAGQSRTAYIRRALVADPRPDRWLPTPQPPPYNLQ
jgi:hypothetical protein